MDRILIKIKNNIKTGDLSGAMSLLLEVTSDPRHPFHREIIIHSANLHQIVQEERMGTVPIGYINREKKRITLAILELIDELAKEDDADSRVETESRTALKVFISYSSDDRNWIRHLYDRLRLEDGIDPWLDNEKLLPGVDWDLEIKSAVKASHVVLVCLSKNSVNKEGYIQKEIRQALDIADEKPDGTIYIVPLRLEDCKVPERLKRWQWLDMFEKDSYSRLLSSLRRRAVEIAAKNLGA